MSTSITVRDHDVQDLADILAAAREEPVRVGLPEPAMTGLAKLIPCDQISFFELDSECQTTPFMQTLLPEEDDDAGIFWAHYWDCYACCYPDKGDDRPVTAFSDFYGPLERRRIGMYTEYFKPYGTEDGLMLVAPIAPRRTLRMEFSRGPGPEFTDRDRAILLLLRPHLRDIYFEQRAVEHRTFEQSPPLTQRQRELLRLVAEGRTNSQIARRLAISEGTVRKHLENIFERLGVTNRMAAVIRAFPQRITSA